MRFVSECTVTLIGQTEYHDDLVDAWCKERGIDYDTDAEFSADAIAEFAGRVCYLSLNEERRRHSGDGQNRVYLDHIREVGHGSVLEHATFNFLIDDFSKNCTQELVRHRVGTAYSCQSSRYVDMLSDAYFGDSGHRIGAYVPQRIKDDAGLFGQWRDVWNAAALAYKRAVAKLRGDGLDIKEARSLARHILPGGACNALVFSVNARELRHIFHMRGSIFADPEIRTLAIKLFRVVKDITIFKDIWEGTEDGHPVLKFNKATVLPTMLDEIRRLEATFGVKVQVSPN